MGESVARRSGCTAQAAEPTGVVAKGIADIVKPKEENGNLVITG
jgi:hypothetical protein